jgi:hypothetical protein
MLDSLKPAGDGGGPKELSNPFVPQVRDRTSRFPVTSGDTRIVPFDRIMAGENPRFWAIRSLTSRCRLRATKASGRKRTLLIGTKTGWNRRRAAVVLALASALAVAGCQDSQSPSASRSQEPPSEQPEPTPEIPQAKWKMSTRPVGRAGKLTKRQVRRHKAQRPRVKGVVREVYEALFLEPESIKDVIAERFSRRAGRALLRAGPGFRPGAERVKTTKRIAKIGLQAHTASAASAQVFVKARARGPGNVVKLRHKATMWMQRINNEWRVIAFEVDQERAG